MQNKGTRGVSLSHDPRLQGHEKGREAGYWEASSMLMG